MKKIAGGLVNLTRPSRNDHSKAKYYYGSRGIDDDLDDIAVVSNATPENVRYGSGGTSLANGPRLVPGIITTTGTRVVPSSSNMPRVIHSPIPPAMPIQQAQSISPSSQSLVETVTGKLQTHRNSADSTNASVLGSIGKTTRRGSNVFNKNHLNVENASDHGRRNIDQRRSGNNISRKVFPHVDKSETLSKDSEDTTCKWTFVFDPSGRLCYYWSMVVSVAFLYNFWVIIYRFSFKEINSDSILFWFTLDYLADIFYLLDILFHFRTGYLEEGVLQTDSEKLRNHYMNSTMFYIDALCLLPLDFLYLSINFNSILRCFRLVKIYRFWAFLDRTERHTNYPNVFRSFNLTHYVLVIFHWNACISHMISQGDGSISWLKNTTCNEDDVTCQYIHAFYWSTLAFTTIGDLPRPETKGECLFLVVQIVVGLFLFAAVLGHVANIVTNVSAARKEFQAKLDAVKTYMRMRHVPEHLQNKVIRWFDYLWMTQKSADEERSVGCLPDKLKAEIAIHVHLDTLKRVEIFQNTEAGFLCELVLRLRPVLFSPGDYICRKGEVGKEMYIVNRGRLQVVADNGKTVLATLRAGSYFGEISILNMGTAGNRRTASVRSVGYSDLFCLYKHDMWDVLKDYPAARVRLESIAVKRLEKYKKEPLVKKRVAPYHLAFPYSSSRMHPEERAARSRVYASEAGLADNLMVLEKVALGRSRSTPGLLESQGRISLEESAVGKESGGKVPGSEPLPPGRSTSSSSSASSQPEQQQQQRKHQATNLLRPSAKYLLPNGRPPHPNLSTSRHSTASPLTDYTNISPTSDAIGTSLFRTSPGSAVHVPMMQDATEALLAEIKRLRERLVTLEAENSTMSMKLSQQQWEVENRLAEIEMQICSGGSGGTQGPCSPTSSNAPSPDDQEERNRESII